jgi:phage shock protein C
MYCNYCGKEISQQANICVFCGRHVGPIPVPKHLWRPRKGRWIGGVTQAFAHYLDMDVSLIRVVWLMMVIFGGTGVLAYVVCWIVIPSEPEPAVQASPAQAASPASPTMTAN